jgi:hypothetical protein
VNPRRIQMLFISLSAFRQATPQNLDKLSSIDRSLLIESGAELDSQVASYRHL